MGLLVMGVLAGACSGAAGKEAADRRSTTTLSTAAPSPSPPDDTIRANEATTTTAGGGFPAVIVQAMSEFTPLPAGARAPVRLPATRGYVTAETGGLGGQANVTLIVTTNPLPVDSPMLSSAGVGRELASFSTTPTASSASAGSEMGDARSQELASCQSYPEAATLADGIAATSCTTIQGAALNWTVGNWAVQVLSLDGASTPMVEADNLAGLIAGGAPSSLELPMNDAGGIVSVVVPGSASAGTADTAAIEWSIGADVYQVRSSDDPDAAVAVAAVMEPYPA